MTGLEILFLLGGAGASFVGSVLLWIFATERKKSLLLDALAKELDVLAERNGNIDRPVGLTLQGKGSVVDVDAVVRGDHALWHLRSARQAEEEEGEDVFVVVDVDWQEAVRERRSLSFVAQLTPRYVVFASNETSARARLWRRETREDLCAVLLAPVPAKCMVVTATSVFLELPRVGLEPRDVHEALARVEDAVAVLAGRRIDRARTAVDDVGEHAPSGCPFAVAIPRFA